ncbi:MAG: aconitate hydratase [Bacteroidetes bacterium]|nr:aconitate hydratase [Bacteroidota bacterium]HET6245205.1 aconitate hydratase [Bacteroidia bacterium]
MEKLNVTQKLIQSHLIGGEMIQGQEIALKIDQALLQDATGTLVMLELEAMGLRAAKTEIAVQYVDHNILQTDFKNADDHIFLKSAAEKFGIWFSRPGNGVSHPVHMERFGKPGKTLLGADSHTCAGGALGMLAMGTGGIDVAAAIAGEPYYVRMPKIMGIELKGKLPEWVSAKDIILEILRIRNVKGGVGYIFEYFGDGLDCLNAMDRHVICNMGAELGATTSVFPSDDEIKRFLYAQYRDFDWTELKADEGAEYDEYMQIDLSELEPMIACPSSPGNVVKVSEIAGKEIHQSIIGSSANPGIRDFWIASQMVKGKNVDSKVSFDINPTSRQIVENLSHSNALFDLVHAGARFHQSGCLGCIGMGQAPATNKISLRTMPRNFPGRSGTFDDQVYLCSPETAAASAIKGEITDPRDFAREYNLTYPVYEEPEREIIDTALLLSPTENEMEIDLIKGPNIKSIPTLAPLPRTIKAPVLLKLNDNVSTDEILKAGAIVLPFRSNIPEISKWAFHAFDAEFLKKSEVAQSHFGGHFVVAGDNYAQGSSREHAALAPRYLGQFGVIAKSYARIGWQNLINFGIVPFEFEQSEDYEKINQNDVIYIKDLYAAIEQKTSIPVKNTTQNYEFRIKHNMSERQMKIMMAGGAINLYKKKLEKEVF